MGWKFRAVSAIMGCMTEDAQKPKEEPLTLPGRIVVVDDDNDIRKLVRRGLEVTGQDIVLVTCSTGQELLSRFRELQPDVLILDLVLGDMDGPTLLQSLSGITEAGYTTPVIFLTGKSKLIMVEDYRHLGVIGVIHKPFEIRTLAAEVAAMWKAYQMDRGEVLE
jgi:two-component system, OmpR family, response regulator